MYSKVRMICYFAIFENKRSILNSISNIQQNNILNLLPFFFLQQPTDVIGAVPKIGSPIMITVIGKESLAQKIPILKDSKLRRLICPTTTSWGPFHHLLADCLISKG